MGVMAVGMWRARYWAGARIPGGPRPADPCGGAGWSAAGSAPQLVGNLALIAVAGTLCYLMIKALARIQMPERSAGVDVASQHGHIPASL